MHSPLSPTPLLLTSLQEIANRYDVFLVDVTGVVYDGVKVYPGVVESLNHLIKQNKDVVFLSNNPRPGNLLEKKLEQFGIHGPFRVFTSGDATRLFLQDHLDKRVFHLGNARNQDLLRDLSVQTVETPQEADLIVLSAFIEQNESIAQFDSLLQTIAALKIPVLCANPDKIAVHGDTVRSCAGTFAEKLKALGATVTYYGKPSLDFYTLFYETFLKERNVPRAKILMIGDTMENDIEGAHRFQIDSLLVLTGNTGSAFPKGKPTPQELEEFLAPFEQKPTYYQDSLSW